MQKADRAFWVLGTPQAHPLTPPLKSGRPYMQRSGPRGMLSFQSPMQCHHLQLEMTSCTATHASPASTVSGSSLFTSGAQAAVSEDKISHLLNPPTIEVNDWCLKSRLALETPLRSPATKRGIACSMSPGPLEFFFLFAIRIKHRNKGGVKEQTAPEFHVHYKIIQQLWNSMCFRIIEGGVSTGQNPDSHHKVFILWVYDGS